MADLDMANILEEAKARWLRPNEIHAILYNYKYFNVQVKPVNLPASMLRGQMGEIFNVQVKPLTFLY